MTSQTCTFKIDEKNIDVIFEVCCMALYLIEEEIERNQRLRRAFSKLSRDSFKTHTNKSANLAWEAESCNIRAKKLKSVAKTIESIMYMQSDKCSFGFEVSGMDVPLEHMNSILAYAREHRNTLENGM